MKAAVYYATGQPDVFKYEERPDPDVMATSVLIGVEAISIEGGDVLNRAGGEMPSKPHVVGYQCAGTIKQAGDSVSDRKVGDRVVATMP
ncbi:MAG: zinc-binding alcohol dehydrogenase family protein, partial [Chloroflexi bacterium]|nr:zinc-binding alcohol dehydrogenase family protein [Chloroflexota bacterium]